MNWRQILILASALIWTGGFASARTGAAHVRGFHLSTDAPAANALHNGRAVLMSLPYRCHTDFIELAQGACESSVNWAGTDAEGDGEIYTVESGRPHTVPAMTRVDNGTIRLLATGEDRIDLEPGSTNVRMVQAASNAPEMDAYPTSRYRKLAGQAPVLSSVPYPTSGNNLTIPMGLSHGRVAVAGSKTAAIHTGPVRLKTGEIRIHVAADPVEEGGSFESVIREKKN